MNDKFGSLLASRRFWLALFGVAAVVLNDTVGIPEDQVMEVAGIIIAWILGDSLRKTE